MPWMLARALPVAGVLAPQLSCNASSVEPPDPRLVLLYAPCTVNKHGIEVQTMKMPLMAPNAVSPAAASTRP
jgi:hypothetical protein